MSSHEVLSTIAIVASVVSSAAALSCWLASKFEKLESRLSRLEDTVSRLENAFLSYNELLLKILEAKGVLTPAEGYALIQALKASLPKPSSKYYTKEVEERLKALLDKDPKEYTLEDVKELERIADLMFEEYRVTRRKDLLEYQARLRVAAQVIKIVFVEPKIKGEQALKPGPQEKLS
ncbi:MAG: hypothetical protein QXQ60_05400 [Thermofilum sp.]